MEVLFMEDKFNDNNLSDETLSDDADYSANERHDDGSSTEKKDLLSHSDDLLDNHSHKNVNYHVSADSHYLEDNKNKVKNAAFVSEKPEKNKMDKGLKVFLITSAVIFGSLFLIFGASILANFLKTDSRFNSILPNSNNQNSSAIIHTKDIPEKDDAKTAEQIYQEIAPSIVGVVTYIPSAGLVSSSTGQGSGIIISENGYVVTNAHVIGNSNKYNVTVVTSDHKEFTAKIIGFDTRTDLAVLKIDASGLKSAEFGNSDQLSVGASVLAIGNPGGLEFSNSLTRGVVSALNRSLASMSSNSNASVHTTVKYIQTDAAINPGNSGGALLNMYGQVIGINSSKASDYEGMGFAIPSNTVKTVVDDIIKNGYVSGRVKMGISVRALSAYEAQINNVPQGLVVMEIAQESNAGANGLRVGDIITKFDGVDTRTTSALYNELAKHKPGDTVNVTVHRLSAIRSEASTSLEINITLIEDKGEAQ